MLESKFLQALSEDFHLTAHVLKLDLLNMVAKISVMDLQSIYCQLDC